MKEQKHFSVRIEEELLKKFRIVCIIEGRSLSGQIGYMIRRCVEQFERENGEIVTDGKMKEK